MKNLVKTIELNMAEIVSAYAFAPIGGGGNPLRAWVLACFNSANNCIDWIFTDLVKFIRYPELVSGFCAVEKMEDIL